nr:GntR family transcriptional regulator [Pararoseomonas indoligenes]
MARRLREDIVFGRWFPGTWLKQSELEQHYGAGRSEVRGALAETTRHGLVEHEPNRGYRVTRPDPVRQAELRAVRAALEGAAAELVAANATPADIALLRDSAETFAAAVPDGDRHVLVGANHGFHRSLYALCGNATMAELIRDLRERAISGTTGRWATPRGLVETAAQHLRMVEAIAARDAPALRRLIETHILYF